LGTSFAPLLRTSQRCITAVRRCSELSCSQARLRPRSRRCPAIAAAVVGEILRIRSWIYYVLAGGASLAVIPLLVTPSSADLPAVATSQYMTIFVAAGFAGGFIYWLLAGARA
jgi:hypothetical protein